MKSRLTTYHPQSLFPFLSLLLSLFLFLPAHSYGQGSARVENIRLDVNRSKVLITYDLESKDPGTKHDIRIFFSDHKYNNRVYPTQITGDVGPSVAAGKDRVAVWDPELDKLDLSIPLQCNVMVDNVLGDGKEGGPAWAFASLAIPGLGDYFVADPSDMAFKPWYRTASALALTGAGLLAADRREPTLRYIPGHMEVMYSPWGGVSHEVWVPEKWVRDGTDYLFFTNDAEVMIGLGAAIWITDVIWVMNKGYANHKIAELSDGSFHFEVSPTLSMRSGIVSTGLVLSF